MPEAICPVPVSTISRAAIPAAKVRLASILVGVFPSLLIGCATPNVPAQPTLLRTEWRIDHFESSDDAIGTIRPRQGEVYTLQLNPDGTVAAGLSCNRGVGSWVSPDARALRGSLQLQLSASTMAACPPGALDRLPSDLAHVRSFVIAEGRLHLNLMMDGGNYVWLPSR